MTKQAEPRAEVVVVGSAAIDFTARAPRLPRRGETVLGNGFLVVPGGKGNNQAIAAARQGASTAMVACIGTDDLGDAIVALHHEEGMGTSAVERDPRHPTGVAHIMVDDAGDNLIVVVPRANHALDPALVGRHKDLVASATVVLAQLEIPLESVEAALRIARAAGATTLLNPAPARELPSRLLELVDVCMPNETEAAMLSGRPVAGPDDAAQAAAVLVARGCRAVVVTLGSQGAVCVDAHGRLDIAPFTVDAVDATAAGDAFCGTFAAALARGDSRADALRRAAAAGALATTLAGAVPSLPDAAAVDAMLAGA